MVMRYAHPQDKHVKNAVKAIGRGLPSLSEAKNPDTITPRLHGPGKMQRDFSTRAPANDLKSKAI